MQDSRSVRTKSPDVVLDWCYLYLLVVAQLTFLISPTVSVQCCSSINGSAQEAYNNLIGCDNFRFICNLLFAFSVLTRTDNQ